MASNRAHRHRDGTPPEQGGLDAGLLDFALSANDMAAFVLTREGAIEQARNAALLPLRAGARAQSLADVVGESNAERIIAVRDRLERADTPPNVDIELSDLLFECSITEWGEGESGRTLVVMRNCNAERTLSRTVNTLLREVSHRSKNLLAIIQSIATQTANASGTTEDFLKKFRGRINSMAQSQNLVTDSEWSGSDIFSLVRLQFENFFDSSDLPVALSGDNEMLSPNASLNVGLALHELISNSMSDGALSEDGAMVVVTCNRVDEDDGSRLELRWEEDIPASGLSCREANPGFGSKLLKTVGAHLGRRAEQLPHRGGNCQLLADDAAGALRARFLVFARAMSGTSGALVR